VLQDRITAGDRRQRTHGFQRTRQALQLQCASLQCAHGRRLRSRRERLQTVAQQRQPPLWSCGVQHRRRMPQLRATALIRLCPRRLQSPQGVLLTATQDVEPRLRLQRLQPQSGAVGALCCMAQQAFMDGMQAPCL
jgi:hypothetical protein